MSTPATPASLAAEAYAAFERRERGDETIVVLRDNAPEWIGEIVRAAHGDMLPDDWRYATIRAAFGHIEDAGVDDIDSLEDDAHEFADGHVDAYSGARIEWLGSNLRRASYCDDAVDEGLIGSESTIVERIGVGQYVESLEVYHAVVEGLRERLDEIADEEGDDDE